MNEPCARITVREIATRLDIGLAAVYQMLEQKQMPGIRVGHRWVISRRAYEEWEKNGVALSEPQPAQLLRRVV